MRIEDAYAECGRITRREAKNFAWGIMLLPRAKRLALTALYAYARRVDDIADGGDAPEIRRERLLEVRASVAALPSVPDDDAVLVALADTLSRYPVPARALDDLVEGGLWDVERSRYADWSELREYCSRVAGAVGVACTAVYGPQDLERAFPLAEKLGLALQQINIMRDVPEDWRLGRVYLPRDEMARFGVADDDLAEGRMTAGWRGLMAHQSSRARALLAEGMALCVLLDPRSALCVRTLTGIYVGLLEEIERRRFDVYSARPSLSTLGKLRVIGGGILHEAA
jgi:phytoene synthase